MLSVNILIACVVVLICKYCWSMRRFYFASWKLPGELAFPLIGTTWIFWNTSSEVMKKISDLVKKFGSPFGFWLGTRFVILVSKPEQVEMVINSSSAMDRGIVYRYIECMLGGAGLLSHEGDLWKMHRRLLNPTVQNTKILNNFYAIFNEKLKMLVANLNHQCDKGSFDIYEFVEFSSFCMSCKTVLGVDLSLQRQQNFLKNFTEALHIIGIKLFQPWFQFEPLFRISKYYDMQVRTTSDLRSFIKEILQEKILKLEDRDLGENNEPDGNQSRFFIDECIQLSIEQKCFSEDDIISESLTMLLAGYETSAITVSNVVMMLALHPEYQQKVFEEIRGIFPHNDSVVTAEDLKQLNFTDRVMKETLRLSPTIPFTARLCKEEFNMGEYYVPAKTELIISLFSLHRNKDIWGADAESFNPDHFLPENIEANHPYSFLPFSTGLRNCIGKKQAEIVTRMFVIWLVRNYVFSTDLKLEDLRYTWMIAMKLKGGYQVKMEKRQKY